jgi:nitroreductase
VPTVVADIDFEAFASLARSRRTSLCIDAQRQVPLPLIDEPCALATWAPQHTRTWPWRFAVLSGEGRQALGQAIAEALPAGTDPQRRAKTQTNYLRAPVLVLVGAAPGIRHVTKRSETPRRPARRRSC